jgi:hypothetical protein
MTDDDRRPDEAKADEVERELDEMSERRERLGADIEGTGEEWERKKKDERVPGATGEPADDDEEDEERDDAEELDFGREIDSEQVVGEAARGDDESEDG